MKETEKANLRRVNDPLFQKVFSGDGLDIGAGGDPLMPNSKFPNIKSVQGFDKEQGNAQCICKYIHKTYDFVYSSHCLEHLLDPAKALRDWGALVKPNGYIIIVVPDEDLYEQGTFPSQHNRAHKFTFTIAKYKSWSPVSIALPFLTKHALPTWKVLRMQVEDTGYDYKRLGSGVDQTREGAEANIEMVLQKCPN